MAGLTERVDARGGRWRYRWKGSGLLQEVERPDGTRVGFEYDAFARRTCKRVTEAGTQHSREVRFLWDGHVPLHEMTMDGDAITWLFEPESFAPLGKEDRAGRYSIVTGHLGTPTEMYDDLAMLVWQMRLDAFGVGRTDVALQQCPWRWPGQYEDEETGLLYNRFRYYDPKTGQYSSKDPIGLAGGIHLYTYAFDPTSHVDPLGLACYVADRSVGGLVVGRRISDKQALTRLRNGLDVFADSKSEAKNIAKRAIRGKPMHHDAHGAGFYPHYHPSQHANASHVFYGLPASARGVES